LQLTVTASPHTDQRIYQFAQGYQQFIALFAHRQEINAAAVVELLQLGHLSEGIPVEFQEFSEIIVFFGDFTIDVNDEITGLLFGEKFSECHDYFPVIGF
jgi:hypothetical protein